MKSKSAIRGLLLGTVCAVLTGCASYPVSQNLRQEARPVALAQVSANPSAYKGTIVIWGGRVIKTVNDSNGAAIYVVQLPLTSNGRPAWNGISTGRFIAQSASFVDPEVFKNGQLITVAGEIAGARTEPLQELQYAYPVITIKELHLWHFVGDPYYYYYPGWSWYWGWHGPGWGLEGPRVGWDGPGWGRYWW